MKDPVPIVQEAEWAPGPVWTGAENLAPTGIRSPDRPASSQSLYRLSYNGTGYYNKNIQPFIRKHKRNYVRNTGVPLFPTQYMSLSFIFFLSRFLSQTLKVYDTILGLANLEAV